MWRFIPSGERRQISPAPNVVALAVHVLAGCLALLRPQLRLLLSDPIQLRNGEDPDGVDAHALRGRDTDTPRWGMDAEMDVLDVLQNHVHLDVTQLELRHHQYSPCALMIRKMRSTSASSRRVSYSAALMTCSRAWTPRHPSGRTRLTAASSFSARSSTGSREAVYPAGASATRSARAGVPRAFFKLL